MVQGFSCVLTGLIGSGNATTAYNENIGGDLQGHPSTCQSRCYSFIALVPHVFCKTMPSTIFCPMSCVCALLCSDAADARGQPPSHPSGRMHCHHHISHWWALAYSLSRAPLLLWQKWLCTLLATCLSGGSCACWATCLEVHVYQ